MIHSCLCVSIVSFQNHLSSIILLIIQELLIILLLRDSVNCIFCLIIWCLCARLKTGTLCTTMVRLFSILLKTTQRGSGMKKKKIAFLISFQDIMFWKFFLEHCYLFHHRFRGNQLLKVFIIGVTLLIIISKENHFPRRLLFNFRNGLLCLINKNMGIED